MSNWNRGSTRQWRRTRAYVLARDGYRCRAHEDGWCDRVPGTHTCTYRAPLDGPDAGHAHHVHGRAKTGDDPRWIVASCRNCNLHLGDPTKHTDPTPKPVTRW
ncbi:HNH endonuclease [Micromonospora chersina]|uniref:HNH endonuclease n=1 Tax=Micromonospora chersina TaxID=47854 RepID=UPI0037964091